jgi:CRISPR/Cas system endoribonuclease Cas6 (RAMP superfamily)
LNVKIREAMIKGNEKDEEFYEQLKKKLTDIYNSMPDKD